jgi:hypothetical protein
MSYHFSDPTSEGWDQMPLDDEDCRIIRKYSIRIAVIAWTIVFAASLIYYLI